jgi:hypothetical protein
MFLKKERNQNIVAVFLEFDLPRALWKRIEKFDFQFTSKPRLLIPTIVGEKL